MAEFPNDKVKELSYAIIMSEWVAEADLIRHISTAFAIEIAQKMAEFNKISKESLPNGLVAVNAKILVVVP